MPANAWKFGSLLPMHPTAPPLAVPWSVCHRLGAPMLRKLLTALAVSPFVFAAVTTVLGTDTWTWGT